MSGNQCFSPFSRLANLTHPRDELNWTGSLSLDG